MPNPPQLLPHGVTHENNPESLTPNLTPSSNIAAAPIRKRRNGLTPACEPCRKAKVRCGTSPPGSLCSRCRKRKTDDRCIFLDAPMTRRFREFSSEGGASTFPTPKSPSRSAQGLEKRTPSSSTGDASPGLSRKVVGPSGFLGSTSFSATIHDHEEDSSNECGEMDPVPDIDPAQVATGLNVLKVMPKHDDCQSLLKRYLDGPGEVGFLKPSIQNVLDRLFATYQPELKEPRKEYELEKLSEAIARSSAATLILPNDAIGWMAAFSGPNTRWESMGILLTAIAYGVLAVPDREYAFLGLASAYSEKKKAVLAIKEGIEGCLELCKDSLNTLVCNLLYRNLLLETVLHGDSSLSVWRLHHDLVAVASAIGLHCYNPHNHNPRREPGALSESWHGCNPEDPGIKEVTLRTEMRKRLSASCFWNDKELAMFTGRPPAWSHRYHSCPLPFDLSDEALMEEGERLRREIEELDENGWNTKGEVHDATICRTMVLTATIIDEIMEVFIGNASQWSMERVRALKTKAFETYSQIPQIMQITKESLKLCNEDVKMWKLMFMRLDYLRMNFLLERLSAERGGESRQKLVDVAREILDMIVFLWLERDRSGHRHHDYDYVIMCYGMPSTGILCTELLKQTKQPNEVDVRMPISEVVQNLSLMIGFLDWTQPTAGNYNLCRRMSQVIKRVLDQAFTPRENERAPESEVPPNRDPMTDFLSFDDLDDFEWLRSIDWGRGPYIDMIHLN